MVNYGVSRGCETCKKRKKKCDETRPACNICIKSRRVCPGYHDISSLTFRHFKEPRIITSKIAPPSADPSDAELQRRALSLFLADFVVEPAYPGMSRGFLNGMQILLKTVEPQSEVASAARIVALACYANRMGRRSLIRSTEKEYGALLSAYQKSLSKGSADNVSVENLYTAILLGLFEIIVSSDECPVDMSHARGVCAILESGVSPLDLKSGVQVFHLGSYPLLKSVEKRSATDIVFEPAIDRHFKTLDINLIKLGRLLSDAEDILVLAETASREELLKLEEAAADIDQELCNWSGFVCDIWAPETVGHVSEQAARSSSCPFVAAGPVETYFDYHVAALWNMSRKTLLMLLDVRLNLARRLSREDLATELQDRAKHLVACIISSIPYHLTADVRQYVQQVESGATTIPPKRPVGGLLLLHPIYGAAKCSIVPLESRLFLGDCLAWIGKHMGIGQANLLAESVGGGVQSQTVRGPSLPFQHISEGHVLIWTATMLQPAQAH